MADEGKFSEESLVEEIATAKAKAKAKAQQDEQSKDQENMQDLTAQTAALAQKSELDEKAQLRKLEGDINTQKQELDEVSKKIPNFSKYLLAFIIAVFADLLDYVGLAIPIIGDVVDLIISLVEFSLLGFKTLVSLIELIPGADILPLHVIAILIAYFYDRHKSKDARVDAKRLEEALKNSSKEAHDLQESREINPSLKKDYSFKSRFKGGFDWSAMSISFGKWKWTTIIIILVAIYVLGPILLGQLSAISIDPTDAAYQAENSILGGGNFVVNAYQSFRDRIDKNIQKASGEYDEGDQVESSFAGIEFNSPLLPNPKKAQQKENIEISTRIHGFSTQEFSVVNSCYAGVSTDFSLGSEFKVLEDKFSQPIFPKNLSGSSFIQEVTCYTIPTIKKPKDTWLTYIQSEVQDLQISSNLVNYFIKQDQLVAILESAGRSSTQTLDTEAEINSAIRSQFDEIPSGDIVSLSDPGPLNVVVTTSTAPAIGIEAGSTIKIGVSLENTLDGRLTQITGVRLLIPDGLVQTDLEGIKVGCQDWDDVEIINGQHQLNLNDEAIQSKLKNSLDIKKGTQLRLPSCTLTVSDLDSLLFGGYSVVNPATFTAVVQFDYAIQELHRTTIECEDDDPSCQTFADSTKETTTLPNDAQLDGFYPSKKYESVFELEEVYGSLVEQYKSSVPSAVIYGVMFQESKGDPKAVSPSGCKGLMQFCAGTASSYGLCDKVDGKSCVNKDLRFNPVLSIQAGAKLLEANIAVFSKYSDKYHFALAAYNAGPAVIKKAIADTSKADPFWSEVSAQLSKDDFPDSYKTSFKFTDADLVKKVDEVQTYVANIDKWEFQYAGKESVIV